MNNSVIKRSIRDKIKASTSWCETFITYQNRNTNANGQFAILN